MAEAYVVDTGVFVRWFIEQIGFEHALAVQKDFVDGTVALETVDNVRVELGHVLRNKGLLLGKIDRSDYLAAVRAIDDLAIHVHTTDDDALERSAALAADYNLRFFDAILASRALDRGLPLLTADKKLCHAVAGLVPTVLLQGIG